MKAEKRGFRSLHAAVRIIACGVLTLLSLAASAQANVLSTIDAGAPMKTPDFTLLDNAKFRVIYDFTHSGDPGLMADSVVAPVVLLIGPEKSLFTSYYSFVSDSVQYANRSRGVNMDELRSYTSGISSAREINPLVRDHGREDSIKVYHRIQSIRIKGSGDGKNFSTANITSMSVSAPILLFYNAPAQDVWTITEERKMIGSVEATKATGHLHGRDWTVWFAESLPYFEGPWELAGLPGLVLEAADADGNFKFKVREARAVDTPMLINDRAYRERTRDRVLKVRSEHTEGDMGFFKGQGRFAPPITTFLDKE